MTSELNEIIKMIDALMAGEFERCSSADLNRPLVGTDTEVLEKVSNSFLCLITKMNDFIFRTNYFQYLWGCYGEKIGHS